MVSFFGIVHQSGGCGPELLGAINLLRRLNVPVRCIAERWDIEANSGAARWLVERGVHVVEYRPGMFEKCPLLVSFGEDKCFDYMRAHSDRPQWMMWSGCMADATEADARAIEDGLVDEYIFQTEQNAARCGGQLARSTGKKIPYRKGYVPFIDPQCELFPFGEAGTRDDRQFVVGRATRDDEAKWHEDSWRMYGSVYAPVSREVQVRVIGWGDNAQAKVGNPCDPTSRWNGFLNVSLTSHVYDPVALATFFGEAHTLLHYYPFVENHPFAVIQAMLCGVVPIGADEGGFQVLVGHGKTGFLANSADEASYYASKLAFEPKLRDTMGAEARRWVIEEGPGCFAKAVPWWKAIVEAKNAGGRV
jgi:hypothetical protein